VSNVTLHPFTETPAEFAQRMGIALKTFSRKVRRQDCPQNFEANEGRTGRFISLRASPELERFMRTDPRKGKSAQPLNASTSQL
jgi:hypothetical protein